MTPPSLRDPGEYNQKMTWPTATTACRRRNRLLIVCRTRSDPSVGVGARSPNANAGTPGPTIRLPHRDSTCPPLEVPKGFPERQDYAQLPRGAAGAPSIHDRPFVENPKNADSLAKIMG